jgi:hypothetical protein
MNTNIIHFRKGNQIMTFTEWLVEKEYSPSEDKYDIESSISATEADELYELYLLDNGTIWGYTN